MSYIPPLIFSSLSLLDPAITAILSWLMGLEDLPTIFPWLGGAIVVIGVGIISLGEKHEPDSPAEDDEDDRNDGNTVSTSRSSSSSSLTARRTAAKRHGEYGQLNGSDSDEEEEDVFGIEMTASTVNKEEFAKKFTIDDA
jgi:hypothetical protein